MGNITFHRPARSFPETVPQGEIKVVAPPTLPTAAGAMATLIQNMLMPVAGLGGMAYLFVFSRNMPIFVIIAIATASGVGVLAPILSRWAQDRVAKKQKLTDQQRYTAHLGQLEKQLRDAAEAQLAAALRLHPDPEMLQHMARQRETVWERRPHHDDFLQVRIGTGDQPLNLCARLDLGTNPLLVYEPELLAVAKELEAAFQLLKEAPVTISLRKYGSVAVVGEPVAARGLLRALLCQMAVFHSPDEVNLALYSPQPETWNWVKWLPHIRDFRRPGLGSKAPSCLRMTDSDSFLTFLQDTTKERSEEIRRIAGQSNEEFSLPHLIFVIDGYDPSSAVARSPVFTEALATAAEMRVTIVSLVTSRSHEPSDVDARVIMNDETSFAFAETSAAGAKVALAQADRIDEALAENLARLIAPLRGADRAHQNELARTVDLLDLMHIPAVSSIDPESMWRTASPDDVLRVPIGIGAAGETILLDLKEAAAGGLGPHGMVIGATGSGKSELLRTIVSGLAIGHSPQLLNFVFADFKGGAAFAGLSELPHVAGMITNLQDDLLLVDRMRAALVGEQHRRQRMLRDAGNVDNIREYQSLAAKDPGLLPLPYLLIVVDEFGELLQARPDFLELFTAIGRVGRSLGMHLLLSTQRLDEGRIRGLEGHLRYRICLRTFSAQESQAVIGTADAYHLPSFPGVGYIKVDTSIYKKFKSALISSPLEAARDIRLDEAGHSYSPHARARERASGIALFDGLRTAVATGQIQVASTESDEATEMTAVVERITKLTPAGHVHQVWLPPLPTNVPLLDIESGVVSGPPLLCIAAGLLDKPEQQTQEPFGLDFSGSGGHLALVGAPLTGKSTFLRTVISAFALSHHPEDVQFYCLDMGGGSLHRLETLPHVGSVCGKHEREKVLCAIRQMHSIIEEREPLFRREGIDSMATFRRRRAEGSLTAEFGDCFLVIDNWAQLRHEFEDIDSEIQPLLAGGLAYGVHVIITTGRWNDVRSQLRDSIGTRLEFRLNDAAESEMPRGSNLSLPAGVPGRGVTPSGLHFQTAIAQTAGDDQELVAEVKRRWPGEGAAPPLRLLPAMALASSLPPPSTANGVPLALQEFSLVPAMIDLFRGDAHFLILGDSESGKTSTIRSWMNQLARRYSPEEVKFLVLDYRRTLIEESSKAHLLAYAGAPAAAAEVVAEMSAVLAARLPGPTVSRDQLMSRSWWQGPEYVLFVDDYDLVASTSGNPLSPLVELLVHGRDVGFHLVLARRVGGVGRSSFEPVFQRVRELGSPGFILSGDPQEGPLLGTQKAAPLPAGRAFWVRRGERTVQVQLLYSPPAAGG